MPDISLRKLRKRLLKLGYKVRTNVTANFGGKEFKFKYGTYPNDGPGSHNFFTDLQGLEKYATQVERVREWQGVENTIVSIWGYNRATGSWDLVAGPFGQRAVEERLKYFKPDAEYKGYRIAERKPRGELKD